MIDLEDGSKKKPNVHKVLVENSFEMLEDESDMINESKKLSNSLIEILNEVEDEISKEEKVRKQQESNKFQLEEERE